MSRDSSTHKVSIWLGMSSVVSLAVLSRFFSVGGNAEYIQSAQHCYISNKFKAGNSIFLFDRLFCALDLWGRWKAIDFEVPNLAFYKSNLIFTFGVRCSPFGLSLYVHLPSVYVFLT